MFFQKFAINNLVRAKKFKISYHKKVTCPLSCQLLTRKQFVPFRPVGRVPYEAVELVHLALEAIAPEENPAVQKCARFILFLIARRLAFETARHLLLLVPALGPLRNACNKTAPRNRKKKSLLDFDLGQIIGTHRLKNMLVCGGSQIFTAVFYTMRLPLVFVPGRASQPLP